MENEQPKKSKRFITVLSIALCVIFIPIIVLNTVMIIKTYVCPDHIPGLFGIKPVIVLSDSMIPEFASGALVFVGETDTDKLKAGDIICYLSEGTPVAQRIFEIITNDGQTEYLMKSDAETDAEPVSIKAEQIEGKYIGQMAGFGGAALFMQSPVGMALFIGVPILIYLGWDFIRKERENRTEKKKNLQLMEELDKLRGEKENE